MSFLVGIETMRFGSYDCFTLEMDSFLLDGGAMFGVVPKNLWEKKIPADAMNRIPMQARSLIIRGNGKVILVDTGIGDKLSDKFKKIYDIQTSVSSMAARLEPFELTVEDITDVILTHLHFDHVGGSTAIVDGQVVATFPNAVYHVQAAQWELACNPSVRDRSSYIPDNFMPLLEQKVLNLVKGPAIDFFDGIDLIVTDGHTQGQHHPLIKGDTTSLFYCADLIPTSAHIPTAWHMGYDNYPLNLMDEKGVILSRAIEENWILCFEHDPVVAAASVREEKGRVVIDQVIEL
ncbi:MAG: MBL fold metallo-hydrolase [Desulfobacteraceae bacterium]|jgi:glyoxylase-like metal-dependent hydrolase (beta-lactamase superfamily II)|nr:MBL fold metallo-hydrolase [Desulfobacteraceae bacterium]